MSAFLDDFQQFSAGCWEEHGLTVSDVDVIDKVTNGWSGSELLRACKAPVMVMVAALGLMAQIATPVSAHNAIVIAQPEFTYAASVRAADEHVEADNIRPGEWGKVISLIERTRVHDDDDIPKFAPMF